jgi:hypothetical protein
MILNDKVLLLTYFYYLWDLAKLHVKMVNTGHKFHDILYSSLQNTQE